MITIILCGLLSAFVCAWLVHPLMMTTQTRKSGIIIMAAVAVLGFAIYIFIGHPDLPAQPALFETQGPRAEERALTGQELTFMQALAEDPTDMDMMLALGSVRIQAGRTDDAIAILNVAAAQDPKNNDVKLGLGAAYYRKGMQALREDNDTNTALMNFDRALQVAPKDAIYREHLITARRKLIEDTP